MWCIPMTGFPLLILPWDTWTTVRKQRKRPFWRYRNSFFSEEIQKEIEATGRRINVNQVSEDNKAVFKEEWGINTDKILSPIQMPDAQVLMRP